MALDGYAFEPPRFRVAPYALRSFTVERLFVIGGVPKWLDMLGDNYPRTKEDAERQILNMLANEARMAAEHAESAQWADLNPPYEFPPK